MKAVAFVLLAACSPAVVAAPSSLPEVLIDRALHGTVCSREAAETIAILRARERGEDAVRLIGCEGRTLAATEAAERYKVIAEHNLWWQQYGLGLVIGSVLASLGIGFGAGFGTAKK